MKASPLLFLAAAALSLRGAPPAAAPAREPGADPALRFSLIGEDYKHAAVLPETVFNPFKVQAAVGLPGGPRKDGTAPGAEAIADAVEHRRVSGLLLAPEAADNRVIIGDQVFGVGDVLEFYDKDKGSAVPLANGVNVILRGVRQDSIALDIGLEGETPRRMDFPLRSFWRP